MNDEGETTEDPITYKMSEEAIATAAAANDAEFMARLALLHDRFVIVGDKAQAGGSYPESMSAYANAMQVANAMHQIAVAREALVRQALDSHADRTDPKLDEDIEIDLDDEYPTTEDEL